jgi:hypothetical protein
MYNWQINVGSKPKIGAFSCVRVSTHMYDNTTSIAKGVRQNFILPFWHNNLKFFMDII